MGASNMSAIGVDRVIIHFLGGWARGSVTMERDYIDPTVMPSPEAFMLYGWALAKQYSVGAGTVERARLLPDPLLEERWVMGVCAAPCTGARFVLASSTTPL